MELAIFKGVMIGFSLISLGILIGLLFWRAPYGRFSTKSFGLTINHRLAWIMMEYPTVFLFLALYLVSDRKMAITPLVFMAIWMFHYFHRTFLYPLTIKRAKPWPLAITFSGMFLQLINVYIQARWIFTISPENLYTPAWLGTPQFIAGVVIFFIGQYVNKSSDRILRTLSDKKELTGDYGIPYGGMYRFVSCPNYLGETLIWLGWAVMLWAPAGFVFLLFTFANLFPRALSYHKWYREKFGAEYPQNRKAFIPFLI